MENNDNVRDDVNHPEHYTRGGIECIDYIKAKLTADQFEGYLKGCVLKYLSRCEIKGSKFKDLRKAKWYLNRLVSECEDQENRATLSLLSVQDREYTSSKLMAKSTMSSVDASELIGGVYAPTLHI